MLEDIINWEDCKQIQAIVADSYHDNDFSSSLEGNCVFKHFTNEEDLEKGDVRANLFKCAQTAKNILEIGFNAGHSAMIFLNSNPAVKITCFDNCFHSYTIPCAQYLAQKYDFKLVCGDSRVTTCPAAFRASSGVPPLDNDVIHIDGGHSKEVVFKDIINCRQVATDKALLILDDSQYPQIAEIIDFLVSCNSIQEIDYQAYGLVRAKTHRIFNYIDV